MDVSASPTYEDYVALKNYVVFNRTEGIIYFKDGRSVGKFSKFYSSKVWQPQESPLSWTEFQDMWPKIQYMMTMNALQVG